MKEVATEAVKQNLREAASNKLQSSAPREQSTSQREIQEIEGGVAQTRNSTPQAGQQQQIDSQHYAEGASWEPGEEPSQSRQDSPLGDEGQRKSSGSRATSTSGQARSKGCPQAHTPGTASGIAWGRKRRRTSLLQSPETVLPGSPPAQSPAAVAWTTQPLDGEAETER